MFHALLLSPDDQAVTAITGVLEEMSVTCERPLDGVSAAQKLNSHSFDLVLVDCENLPAAKLIFDVCRRGKNGHNPVPIAIVDGRAGLPTAFRLGAELILTKPVAKDQARSTVRNAVSRVRRDVPASESVPARPANAEPNTTAPVSSGVIEERAQAAAASASSSPLTSVADPVPSFVSSTATAAPTTSVTAPATTTKLHSTIDETVAPPASSRTRGFGSFSASPSSGASSSMDAPAISESKPVRTPSDDPVLAELESLELADSQPAKSKPQTPQPAKATPTPAAAQAVVPPNPAHLQGRKRTRLLAALLMLTLAGGGFYLAWTYQPAFRGLVQPSVDRLLALVGMAPSPAPAQSLPAGAPSAPQVRPPVPAQNQSGSTGSTSSTGTATGESAPAAAIAGTTQESVPAPAPESNQPGGMPATSTPLPGESTAIVLTSKGAEQRLAKSVPVQDPPETRAGESTVILKEVVGENGKVEGVRLVEGNTALASAAIKAVKQWR